VGSRTSGRPIRLKMDRARRAEVAALARRMNGREGKSAGCGLSWIVLAAALASGGLLLVGYSR